MELSQKRRKIGYQTKIPAKVNFSTQAKTQAKDELFNQAKQIVSQGQCAVQQCSSAAFPSDGITSQGAGVYLPSSRA